MAPNRFQPFSFDSVEEFLDFLPREELEIVEALRGIIFDSLPDVREKLAYNVPFYYLRKRICFIWPAAVPWGAVPRDGVEFGLTSGHLVEDPTGYMELGSRKQVSIRIFHKPADIDPARIRELLSSAAEVDGQL